MEVTICHVFIEWPTKLGLFVVVVVLGDVTESEATYLEP